ncbi:MAG: type II toxin-antitoxin system PemK/MazF family toxin [Terriglobales bacterium]
MSLISDAFQKIGIGQVKVVAGGVYLLRDEVVSIPDSKLAGKRTKHHFRTVVVLSNQTICNSIACPVVTIVPLSHILTPRAETDLIIGRSKGNGLDHDSRLFFGYVQPVLKSDLEKQLGQLDDNDWNHVMGKIVWNFDR